MLFIEKLLALFTGCLLLQACATVDMEKHPYSHSDYDQLSFNRLAQTTPDPTLVRPVTLNYADRSKVLPFG